MNDRTSAITELTEHKETFVTLLVVMVAISGRFPAQWIRWEVEVPESGMYKVFQDSNRQLMPVCSHHVL